MPLSKLFILWDKNTDFLLFLMCQNIFFSFKFKHFTIWISDYFDIKKLTLKSNQTFNSYDQIKPKLLLLKCYIFRDLLDFLRGVWGGSPPKKIWISTSHLVASGGIWWLLVAFGCFWWLLAASGGFWWLLGAAGGFFWLLVASGGFWWLLVASGGFWWLLGALDPRQE